MHGFRREPANSVNDLLVVDCARLGCRLAAEQFRQRGGAGHSGDTALSLKFRRNNASVGKLQHQFKNVTASWILYLDADVGMLQCSRVAGMLKMVEQGGGIHKASIAQRGSRGQTLP